MVVVFEKTHKNSAVGKNDMDQAAMNDNILFLILSVKRKTVLVVEQA